MINTEIFCRMLYSSTFVPIHYYKNGSLKMKWPDQELPFDLTEAFVGILLDKNEDACYHITKEFTYYAFVKHANTDEYVILGPVSSTSVSERSIHGILSEALISPQYKEDVLSFFQMIPEFSLTQFLGILSLLNYTLNGVEISPTEFLFLDENSIPEDIQTKNALQSYQAKEESFFHNTYRFEQEMLSYIEAGDKDSLKKMFSRAYSFRTGRTGETTLRHIKNLFIAAITMVTRSSIAGGMDIETAYQLSDTYIQEMEKLQNENDIQQLQLSAINDFANRVAESRIPFEMSRDIYESIQFISTHLNEPISVETVADSIGKSRSYLSRKFKSELGFQISDYIMRRKLEEAKSLLSFTDKPLSEISEYLCFSSQPYFQNVFKKNYGVTPGEYRKGVRHKR